MDHLSDGAEVLGKDVGRRVRMHREIQRMSSSDLAERSGLSRTIVSRIEHGEGNPSIGTLWRISRTLRVPLGDLLQDPILPRTRVVRAGEGEAMGDPSGMVGRLVHTDGRERRTELFTLDLPAGARRESPGHLAGVEELLVVTRGGARLGPGRAPELLGAGDAIWFAADVAHVYEATEDCTFLCWMLYPSST
ncbi:MAG: helix-turn-helix protein [Solirubrobacterales bacterium]|nr:helix-turn-helix protein [Solirubrobacterales bacterium]